MRSRAARRARKAGRKRIQGVERTPSGRIYRNAAAERELTMSVALDARVRHGLAANLNEAKDPRCASFLGRMQRDGEITRDQLTAAECFARARRRYDAAIAAPRPHPSAPGVRGSDGDMEPEEAQRARAEWLAASDALILAGWDAHSAVTRAALRDEDVGDLAALRFGLRRLWAHFSDA